MKKVKIKTQSTGGHFGTISYIVARNGRTLWVSDTVPYGFSDAARKLAEEHCKKMGWEIVS